MLRLAADADFNDRIVRGLLRRQPNLDLVRVQDVGLRTAGDPAILAWAAAEGRPLLTHDRRTMRDFALARVRAGEPMPGVFIVSRHLPIGQAINEILLVALASEAHEWQDRVEYLPL